MIEKHSKSQRHMDVMDAIYNRHAVRSYTEEKVKAETIHVLLNAAVHAPTAVLEQPWVLPLYKTERY